MSQRTVLITGGGIGIGRATALAFAAAGDHVVVTDILEAERASAADEARRRGGTAEFIALDVRATEALLRAGVRTSPAKRHS